MRLIVNNAFAKRLLSALWLVLVVPEGHLAFACQLMNDDVRAVCCCTEKITGACDLHGHCDGHLAGKQHGCCVVSEQSAHAVTTAPSDDSGWLTPQRPIVAIPVALYLTQQTFHGSALSRSLVTVARSEQSLYLTTRRLRI
ncbi:MAG: hypothetical protein HYX63_05990 [Gammaproteobacteria bacterium]|nr:hypothetical protein [Gammaproteobacteria bacterium]